jgi:acyl-CoA synthetase (AMP-forming)/AMP-acid ligase II
VGIAILDDDGNALEQGKVGEVCFRTVANFRGYWKNDEATNAAFTKDGWFRTGDLGYLDEDEYLFIVDRKKDIIIRGGENISCIEVEEGVYANEGVAECSCFGLPDERMGEVPAAVVHFKPGTSMTPDEIRTFMLTKLAPFKVPLVEHIWVSDKPLPRLGTQKIDKRTVRTMFTGEG